MTPNIDLYIPEIWYDFFVRFLPGAAFVSAIRLLFFPIYTVSDYPEFKELVALAIAGYILGLISEPISTLIATPIESLSSPLTDTLRKIQLLKNRNRSKRRNKRLFRETFLPSKKDAETKFFIQVIVLTIVYIIVRDCMHIYLSPNEKYVIGAIIPVCLLGSIMFAVSSVKEDRELDWNFQKLLD